MVLLHQLRAKRSGDDDLTFRPTFRPTSARPSARLRLFTQATRLDPMTTSFGTTRSNSRAV